MAASDSLKVDLVPLDATSPLASEWQVLKEATTGATAFGALPFVEQAAAALGYRVRLCTGRAADGRLEGAVACFIRTIGPIQRVVIPPFVQYTPMLLHRALDEHEVHQGASVPQLLLTGLHARFSGVALHLQPELQDMRPASWSAYRVHPLYTYRVALSDSGSLFEAWSENVQRQFRKFADAYEFSEDADRADAVVALCADAYGRHGRPLPAPAHALQALVRTLHATGLARIFVLRGSDGVVEAGIVVLHDTQVAHYWIAGSRPGPAMTVLLGKVLQCLADGGIATFDFVGANTPSIAEFKRRFGPELVPYFRVERHRSWGLRALDAVRRRSG